MDAALVKRMEYEFHSANYHSLMEVVTALRTVTGHLVKSIREQSPFINISGLEHYATAQFMLTLYEEIKRKNEVMEVIGIHSLSASQLVCIIELPLTSLYNCLCMFVRWINDGTYDFCYLPFTLKTQLSYSDQSALQQILFKWPG